MMYYGQEVGATNQFPSYDTSRSIKSYDYDGWWDFYSQLISARRNLTALQSGDFFELNSSSSEIYVFARGTQTDSPVIIAFNTMDSSITTNIQLNTLNSKCMKWKDYITSTVVQQSCGESCLVAPLDGYQALLLVPDC